MSTKKSFILHIDSLSIIEEMEDSQIAELFKAIYFYHIGKEIKLSPSVKMAFHFFKNQFDRDKDKYNKIVDRNKSNGEKGGRPPKTQDNPKNPVGYLETQKTQANPEEPKKADSDSGSVSDNVSVSKKDKENINTSPYSSEFEKFYEAYPLKGTKKRAYNHYKKLIKNIPPEKLLQTAINYNKKCKDNDTDIQYIKNCSNFLGDDTYRNYFDKELDKLSSYKQNIIDRLELLHKNIKDEQTKQEYIESVQSEIAQMRITKDEAIRYLPKLKKGKANEK